MNNIPNDVMILITHKVLQEQKAMISKLKKKLDERDIFMDSLYNEEIPGDYRFCGVCESWVHLSDLFTTDWECIEWFIEEWDDVNTLADCICQNCYDDNNGEEISVTCVDCLEQHPTIECRSFIQSSDSEIRHNRLVYRCPLCS